MQKNVYFILASQLVAVPGASVIYRCLVAEFLCLSSWFLVTALFQKLQYSVQQFIKEVGPDIFHSGKRPGKRRPQCTSVEQTLGPVFQMEPEPGLLERLQRTSCNLERCPL